MEQEVTVYPIQTSTLKQLLVWLEEYFGITIGYFRTEIERMIRKEGLRLTDIEALELDKTLLFVHSFDLEKFDTLFKLIKEDDDNDGSIMIILYLIAVIMIDKGYYNILDAITEQIDTEPFRYKMVREDLLNLYIWLKDPQTKLEQKLALKHMTGSIKIKNSFGWFTRNLLTKYLDEYLPDIKTIEEAKTELLTYKKNSGRPTDDFRVNVITYGIYRMFNDLKKMNSPQSDSLCEFIIEYLKFIGILDEDTKVDNQWVRAQIKYISSKPEPPKFEYLGGQIRCSLEDLEGMGIRLF